MTVRNDRTGRRLLPGLARGVLLCAGLAAVSTAVAPARADDAAFREALREQNAHHLREVAPALPQTTSSMIDASGFSEEGEQGPWKLRDGAVAIAVEPKRTASIDLPAFPVPELTVSVEGEEMLTVRGPEGQAESVSFIAQIAELDPDNPHPEIVFSAYTGGAHCCADTRVLTGGADGESWREIEVGGFDGGPLAATDLDADGRFEIATRDNRFLYAFGCYACSAAPLQVLRLENGEITDASARPEYREAHRAWLVNMLGYNGGGEEANGFLAGYVAQKIRLGEGEPAWDFMLEHHDRESDWGLEVCSQEPDARGDCPGETRRLDFPQALARFLERAGYPLPE